MTDPTSPGRDPFEGLDPEVWEILAQQGNAGGPTGSGGAGIPAAGTATGSSSSDTAGLHPGSSSPYGAGSSAAGGGWAGGPSGSSGGPSGSSGQPSGSGPRGDIAAASGRWAALGAALAWAAVVVAAAILDPSGLAAPVAWTGAHPGLTRPWTWLQYVLYASLTLFLLWLWLRRLFRSATPAAPRRWILSRTWLVVVLAVMAAKLVYSAVWMAPALVGGGDDGLPLGTSLPYLVWATGVTGVKALLYGWIPAVVAALLWRPGPARRAGLPSHAEGPTLALLPAALVTLGVALIGGWTADLWWSGSPVGYAYSTDWRLLAPTVASGRPSEIAALLVLWLLLAGSVRATLRRVALPRTASAHRLAGAIGAIAAGLGLAVVQSVIAQLFGTDLPGTDDLWIVPSTYLRLVEGLSFGLLLVPFAALAVWLVPRAPRPHWSWIAAVAGAAVVVGALWLVTRGTDQYDGIPTLAGADPAPVELPGQPVAEVGATAPPGRITVRRDPDGQVVLADQSGAQVILRGVNVNQLGDYYQANPDVPTVAELTEQDFADIAAMGFDAVRLVLSWSSVEPQAGTADEEYVARIRQAISWARTHGIHVVLDMHQDAWGKGVVAPAGTVCRGGTSPMTGWDGAPEWASYYDDAPPCQFTGRDLAPNVLRAFTSFYVDRDDIQDRLVASWGRLAKEFGGDPTVAGYDLLNEPAFAEQAPLTSGMLLGRYHARAIQAIRDGEAAAPGGYAHPVFLEPSIWWSGFGVDPLPPNGFTTDSQVVFAPHLYNESITMDQSLGVTFVGIERGYALAARAAQRWGAPLWSGEWGAFGETGDNRVHYERFTAAEDALRVGSAVWVWKQACGDPHSYPSTESGNIRRMACPDGTPLPSRAAELAPLKRSYPRAAPGRLLSLRANGRSLELIGDTAGAGPVDGTADWCRLDVWVAGSQEPAVTDSTGIRDLRSIKVPAGSPAQDPSGGWRVIGCATGSYRLTLS